MELGGGFGRITEVLEPSFSEVVMLDPSRKNLSIASARLKKTMLLRGDAREIPFAASVFDCVIVVRMLHHLDELEDVFEEIVRVGKDEAIVVLEVPHAVLGRYKGVRNNEAVLIGPCGHRAYVRPLAEFNHPNLQLVERRAAGLFDNPVGRKLSRVTALSKVDSLTSRIWQLKPEVFLKFRIDKGN